MLNRFVVSILVTVAIILATLATWRTLENHEVNQIARVAESESYAARSRLVRDTDAMLQALRNIQKYWATFGHLPREWWAKDSGMEIGEFAGIDLLLWNDPVRSTHYLRDSAHPVFDYRPTNAEWRQYQWLLDEADPVEQDAMLGPYGMNDTHKIHVIMKDADGSGTLIAVIDIGRALETLLMDSSPGYAVTVKWADTLLYARGDVGETQSGLLQREGLIRNSMGVIWQVVHVPTAELVRSMQTLAIRSAMIAGLVIALLMGLLVLENGRARARAATAEHAELKLAELNKGLEQQIAARTQDLEDQSGDLLTIADSVGHDLRNPLNAISTNTQLLELKYGAVLGEDGISTLRQTSIGVHRMTVILDRLLGLSVLANTTFHREPFNMHQTVIELFEELEATEPGTPVELVLDPLPSANADPTLVRTLLTNLLSNALKYSRDKPDRRVEVGTTTSDGVPAWFVKDNGAGFDEASADRLFQAFERLTHANNTKGLGLGLHIAARVVKRHGGRIWAEGRPGEGASFYFTLEAPAPDNTAS